MPDPRVANLARTLVEYCVALKPGDLVAISASPRAAPLVTEVYRRALAAGALPYPRLKLPDWDRILLSEGNDDQVTRVSKVDEMVRGKFDALIAIRSAENTRELANVVPARQALRAQANAPLMETFMRRSAAGELRWVGTLYPTPAFAQDAEMSLEEFENFAFGAMYADTDDPVAHWREIRDRQQRIVDWLANKHELAVKGPDVDMTLSIAGRNFINSDGTHNMPSGEVFTGPVEDSVNGWVRFSYPAVTAGREVEGVELRFADGRVVEASAAKNEEFLLSRLDTDPGARYLGEWAIGTNNMIQAFTKNILFDEKIGGTIHMAIGAGYPDTGSKNKSAVHWDMICDMRGGGTIAADGEVFYESGVFLID